MKRLSIIDNQGCYWTESKETGFPSGYWSKFEQRSYEKRKFFILKAILLKYSMWLSGLKVRLTK